MGWVGNEHGRGFRVAVPHPGAARHLLPILFPAPLCAASSLSSSAASLGSFLPKSRTGIFLFSFPQTCCCLSRSHGCEEHPCDFLSLQLSPLEQWLSSCQGTQPFVPTSVPPLQELSPQLWGIPAPHAGCAECILSAAHVIPPGSGVHCVPMSWCCGASPLLPSVPLSLCPQHCP